MTAYKPETLSPSTLRTWSKSLAKAAPDVLGHAIPLNQAQTLIARALGHADWHHALAVLGPNAQKLPEPFVPASTPDRIQRIGFFFRAFHLALSIGVPTHMALNGLKDFSLPVDFLDITEEALKTDPDQLARFLTHLLAETDREFALEFKLMLRASSLRDAFGWVVKRLPPVVRTPQKPGHFPGLPVKSVGSWVRRIAVGTQAHITFKDILLGMREGANDPVLGSVDELAFAADMLDRMDKGESADVGFADLGRKIAPWVPWMATGIILAAGFGYPTGLGMALENLGKQGWLAVENETPPQSDAGIAGDRRQTPKIEVDIMEGDQAVYGLFRSLDFIFSLGTASFNEDMDSLIHQKGLPPSLVRLWVEAQRVSNEEHETTSHPFRDWMTQTLAQADIQLAKGFDLRARTSDWSTALAWVVTQFPPGPLIEAPSEALSAGQLTAREARDLMQRMAVARKGKLAFVPLLDAMLIMALDPQSGSPTEADFLERALRRINMGETFGGSLRDLGGQLIQTAPMMGVGIILVGLWGEQSGNLGDALVRLDRSGWMSLPDDTGVRA